MTITLRRPEAADAAALGDIAYRAFRSLAEGHGFAPDLPSPEVAGGMLASLIGHRGIFGLAAEVDGKLVGSNFLDERNAISGVGPITIDPEVQDGGVGRALMAGVMQRSQDRGFEGIRLVQAGYHSRSLALYLKLGFDAREHLSCLQGPAIGQVTPGFGVRPATTDDQAACDALCQRTHGFPRGGELADAIAAGIARVVERQGRITGYATAIAFSGHAVAETNDDMQALIGASEGFGGPGFLVPTRNGVLMRWCLAHGLRVTQAMTLMSIGPYQDPRTPWLASVTY